MSDEEVLELGNGDETDLENELMLDVINNLQMYKIFLQLIILRK